MRALFASYVEMKQRQNVLDYDDLLLYFAQMLTEPAIAAEVAARFDHLLVDEYQDTNALQGEIVLALRPQGRGLTVVGDDAQAIYSFRAATVRNILDFPQRLRSAGPRRDARAQLSFDAARSSPPPTRSLRSRPSASPRRFGPIGRTGRLPVLVAVADDADQARFVATRVLANREAGASLKVQAVLFRASHHSAALELELTRRNVPFVKYGGLKFLDAAHVKDAVALMRFAENPRDRVAGFRVAQLVPGVGPKIAETIVSAAAADDGFATMAALTPPGQGARRLSRLRRPHAPARLARRAVAGGDRRRCRLALSRFSRPATTTRAFGWATSRRLERIAASFPRASVS